MLLVCNLSLREERECFVYVRDNYVSRQTELGVLGAAVDLLYSCKDEFLVLIAVCKRLGKNLVGVLVALLDHIVYRLGGYEEGVLDIVHIGEGYLDYLLVKGVALKLVADVVEIYTDKIVKLVLGDGVYGNVVHESSVVEAAIVKLYRFIVNGEGNACAQIVGNVIARYLREISVLNCLVLNVKERGVEGGVKLVAVAYEISDVLLKR